MFHLLICALAKFLVTILCNTIFFSFSFGCKGSPSFPSEILYVYTLQFEQKASNSYDHIITVNIFFNPPWHYFDKACLKTLFMFYLFLFICLSGFAASHIAYVALKS
jgi:hypothetical protein